jgi:hypothetical protein
MAVAVNNRLEILFMVKASSFPRFIVTHALNAALDLNLVAAPRSPVHGGAISISS